MANGSTDVTGWCSPDTCIFLVRYSTVFSHWGTLDSTTSGLPRGPFETEESLTKAQCCEKCSAEQSMKGMLVYSVRAEAGTQGVALFDLSWECGI